MGRKLPLAALCAVILIPALALGCSNGGEKPAATGTAGTAGTAGSGSAVPAAPTNTPVQLGPADQTVVAAGGQVPLVPYTDPNNRFTAKLPQGWRLQELQNAVQATQPAADVSATLAVSCGPGISVAELVQQDKNIGQNIGTGWPDMTKAKPTQVAGVPAQVVDWASNLAGTAIEHVTVYFEGKGCAWKIQLNTFPGTDIEQLRPVFDGTVGSFTFL